MFSSFVRYSYLIKLHHVVGLDRLTNQCRGQYYGTCDSWSGKQKRQLGAWLLKRAFGILLNEGERQIRSQDVWICSNCGWCQLKIKDQSSEFNVCDSEGSLRCWIEIQRPVDTSCNIPLQLTRSHEKVIVESSRSENLLFIQTMTFGLMMISDFFNAIHHKSFVFILWSLLTISYFCCWSWFWHWKTSRAVRGNVWSYLLWDLIYNGKHWQQLCILNPKENWPCRKQSSGFFYG